MLRKSAIYEQCVEFLNISKEIFLEKGKPLFKMLPIQYVNTTLSIPNHYLWFAHPVTWKDAFEKRFINTQYKTASGSIIVDKVLTN